jgi:hypothetical protein
MNVIVKKHSPLVEWKLRIDLHPVLSDGPIYLLSRCAAQDSAVDDTIHSQKRFGNNVVAKVVRRRSTVEESEVYCVAPKRPNAAGHHPASKHAATFDMIANGRLFRSGTLAGIA